jgi:hypothetical protein
LKLDHAGYDMYGHSAGAQFVHRYLQFYDSPKVKKAVAANAGWYTFPNEAINYPYGIKSLFAITTRTAGTTTANNSPSCWVRQIPSATAAFAPPPAPTIRA